MNPNDEHKDRLFWALCARAMQRAGQGFPTTGEEIEEYEAGYRPGPEEKQRFEELLQRILADARKELQHGYGKTAVERGEPGIYRVFHCGKCKRRARNAVEEAKGGVE